MNKTRIKYNGEIPGFDNAWNYASRNNPAHKYNPEETHAERIYFLYNRLMNIYAQFEEDNKCKLLPDYHNIYYMEFECEEHYTWFLLRWVNGDEI